MKLNLVVPTVLLTFAMFAPAGAAPATNSIALEPLTIQTEAGDRDRDRDHRDYRRRHYRPGRHYGHAPRGWHRFHRRPHDWRTRGCIVVGPLWFCP